MGIWLTNTITTFMAFPNAIEPNAKIFVDTAAWIAFVDKSDSIAVPIENLMLECRQKQARLYTTDLVLTEFLNALSSVKFRRRAIDFADSIRRSRRVNLVLIDRDMLEASYNLYRDRPDKEWSLTDCASFVIMKEKGISTAFTSDKHFEQAGFIKLLDN